MPAQSPLICRGLVLIWSVVLVLSSCRSSSEEHNASAQAEERAQAPSPTALGDVSSPESQDAPASTPEDVSEAGVHSVKSGTALAFATGMSWDEAEAIVGEAVASGVIVTSAPRTQTRPLGNVQVKVTTWELEPTHKGAVRSIRLTFFDEMLVAVMTFYEPDPRRTLQWAREYGQGVHGDGWIGWWLRDERIVVQASPDGTILEVMNLEAASRVVPDIETHTLQSWRLRYKVPPPWGAELLEKAP